MESIWQLLVQNGATSAEIDLLKHAYLIIIMIPVVTTVLAVLRYIIGIKSPNIIALLILVFAFLELGFNRTQAQDFLYGLKYGTLLYFIVLITSTVCYALIKKWRMHYIPKMSIVFTSVSIGYIILLIISRFTDNSLFLLMNSFVIVVIATLAENIVTSFARKDLKYSLDLSIRTYIVALFCYVIISVEPMRNLLLNYPYLVIILLIINVYIGRFKGLRLTEYFRFKTILLSNNSNDEQTKSDITK